MAKLMTLDVLSSIKGASASAAVDALFQTIKNAHLEADASGWSAANVASLDDLREDIVMESSETERAIIKGNFPKEKNGYLVVAKVIEN